MCTQDGSAMTLGLALRRRILWEYLLEPLLGPFSAPLRRHIAIKEANQSFGHIRRFIAECNESLAKFMPPGLANSWGVSLTCLSSSQQVQLHVLVYAPLAMGYGGSAMAIGSVFLKPVGHGPSRCSRAFLGCRRAGGRHDQEPRRLRPGLRTGAGSLPRPRSRRGRFSKPKHRGDNADLKRGSNPPLATRSRAANLFCCRTEPNCQRVRRQKWPRQLRGQV